MATALGPHLHMHGLIFDACIREGRLKSEIMDNDGDDWSTWKDTPESFVMPNGRAPLIDLWQRAEGNWQCIRAKAASEDSKAIFIMAHGALGRCMLAIALGLDPSSYIDPRCDFSKRAI